MPELIAPTARVHASFLAAMDELRAEGRDSTSETTVRSELTEYGDIWHDPGVFADYIARLRTDARETAPPARDVVPMTTLWYVDGATYLGRLAIRHRLDDFLREYGGHIGYGVRASARRQGHGTAMLRAALPHARVLGLDSLLVTCDSDNIGSRKVIESCGGHLEDERGGKLRYWICTAG
ncbi:GNAT family N-acetyltransferase [Streptomyces sp. LX-29]|uniref:GNAT family N-acetyltransferase n=1 Tax=Streptomyces sp. LX-29 TaxID=2900152 RepID=UPI00240DB9C8|nr:GNAT family N-acetyltransferase [Streptomyces sp. LX-29]WFB09610.1 GNAT family N-acetyltransferase [Streptomyces sp. LX-29]